MDGQRKVYEVQDLIKSARWLPIMRWGQIMRWGIIWSLVILAASLLSSCRNQEEQQASSTESREPTAHGFAGAARSNASRLASLPTVTPTPQRVGTSAPAPGIALTDGPHLYQIGQQVRSQQHALRDVALLVRSALVDDETITLDIALRNVSDRAYTLTGQLHGWLEDSAGKRFDPLHIDESIRDLEDAGAAPGSPPGATTFVPGGAILGRVQFPLPASGEPYTLHLLDYEPVTLRLDIPYVEPPIKQVPTGAYQVDLDLFSEQDALAPIRLHIRLVEVKENELTTHVVFRNTLFQPYDVTGSISGGDAVLLGADGEQYHPLSVSSTLAGRIAPEGGWQSQEEHFGTITFPRPTAMDGLRFVFPLYSPATISVEEDGTARGWLTSTTGSLPVPTPTTDPVLAAKRDVTQLLARQANAVLSGDATTYLDTYAPGLRAQQQILFDRLQRVPFTSFDLQLTPEQSSAHNWSPEQSVDGNRLEDVSVSFSYSLAGLPEGNVFHHEMSMGLTQNGAGWEIDRVVLEPPVPFWQVGDFERSETEHFLIFYRADSAAQEEALTQEVEAAYSALFEQGLPLESRYVAYFSGANESFTDLTGIATGRLQGVTLSRFETRDDEIVVVNKVFYINGQTLDEAARNLWPDARQSTIMHELVHLALAEDSRPYMPPWLTEGLAVHYARQGGHERRDRLLEDGHLAQLSLRELTDAASLGEHDFSGEHASHEYIYSGAVIAYLIDLYGEGQVLDFYRSYSLLTAGKLRDRIADGAGPTGGSGAATADRQRMDVVFRELSRELTETAVQTYFGRTLEQLDEEVKAWISSSMAAAE